MGNNMDLSLDDMIQRERRAKADQALRSKAPTGPRNKHQPGSGIGNIAPAGVNGKWTHDLHHKNNPLASRVTKSTPSKVGKASTLPSTISPSVAASLSGNRLFTALHGVANVTNAPAQPSQPIPNINANNRGPGINIRGVSKKGTGFAIKGAAGPFVIRASNFAPGTTAEDVKTALLPLGKIISCIIISASPTVVAEIVFEKKEAADRCIAQYNNQMADGRLLHVVLHDGPPIGKPLNSSRYSSPMVVDHNAAREEADRKRRLAHQQQMSAGGGGGVVDGSYGFKAPVLYSDSLVQKRGRGFQR